MIVRPFELKLAALEADHPFAEAMPVVQTAAALVRSFGIGRYAYVNSTASLDMEMPDGKMAGNVRIGLIAASGARGSDVDASLMKDLSYNIDMLAPSDVPDAPPIPVQMTVSAGRYEAVAVKLDKASKHGTYHRNTVDRKKSSLAKLMNKLAKGGAAAAAAPKA